MDYPKGDKAFTMQQYWQVNPAGKSSVVQYSEPKEVNGKNIGRSNETSPAEQATREAKSLEQKYRDKGYVEEGQEAQILALPMLAQDFTKAKGVQFPLLGQPKLDGVRCLLGCGKAWTPLSWLLQHKPRWTKPWRKLIPTSFVERPEP